ncbi:PIN domain nuclease [Frankia sp. Cr2]|uniref:type II toxin-antitoxin system VapC family toxin n=1 Tax=Frankia sp. Cr2 TaxID=3073932 RepID=UPI002AD2765F|nr:PIN domain nuclease [Frankia sp. Cr2]
MIVVDTSAWIELFRGTRSPAHRHLHWLVENKAPLVTTEIVWFELLAGVRSPGDGQLVEKRLTPFPVLPLAGIPDYQRAADLYRLARARGVTVRSLADCLVAVLAIKADARLLHADRDFDHLARVTDLRIEPVE